MSFLGRKDLRICPDCGVPVHSYPAQEDHAGHHQELWALADRVAELEKLIVEARGGKRLEDVKEPPWTAVVEPEAAPPAAVDVTQDALDQSDRSARWSSLDGLIGDLTGNRRQ